MWNKWSQSSCFKCPDIIEKKRIEKKRNIKSNLLMKSATITAGKSLGLEI